MLSVMFLIHFTLSDYKYIQLQAETIPVYLRAMPTKLQQTGTQKEAYADPRVIHSGKSGHKSIYPIQPPRQRFSAMLITASYSLTAFVAKNVGIYLSNNEPSLSS